MRSVTATFNIQPGKEAEADAAITKLVAAVEENEPGAVIYAWHRHAKDPLRILVFEVYADDEAVQTHRETAHLAAFQRCFSRESAIFDPDSVKIERWDRLAAVQR